VADPDEVVLLTGFPSFQAKKMLGAILRSPGAQVFAIVRAKFEEEAKDLVAKLDPDDRRRVELVGGDVASMDLGLSGAEFRDLTSRVTRIHHVAHVSYLGIDRKTAENTNVHGTREVLELAGAARKLEAFVHHSTVHVSGDRTGTVLEEELDHGQSFRNVVEETRAIAEKLVLRKASKIPSVIVRSATIVGDSVTGEVDRMDGPYLLILLMLTSPPDFALPLPGRGDALLNLVPIDHVVRAARALGRHPKAIGHTFHIADPAPLTARRVFERVAEVGGRPPPRGFLPANVTRAILKAPGLDRIAQSPRSFIDAMATRVQYSTAGADRLLGDLTCPPFETYVGRIVAYVQDRMGERRAQKEADELDALS
jgi:thioester reductase-like protein